MICRTNGAGPRPPNPRFPSPPIPDLAVRKMGRESPFKVSRFGRIGNRGLGGGGPGVCWSQAGPESQFSLGETRPAESGLTSGHRSCARLGRMEPRARCAGELPFGASPACQRSGPGLRAAGRLAPAHPRDRGAVLTAKPGSKRGGAPLAWREPALARPRSSSRACNLA
jgi:hypothetical protein